VERTIARLDAPPPPPPPAAVSKGGQRRDSSESDDEEESSDADSSSGASDDDDEDSDDDSDAEDGDEESDDDDSDESDDDDDESGEESSSESGSDEPAKKRARTEAPPAATATGGAEHLVAMLSFAKKARITLRAPQSGESSDDYRAFVEASLKAKGVRTGNLSKEELQRFMLLQEVNDLQKEVDTTLDRRARKGRVTSAYDCRRLFGGSRRYAFGGGRMQALRSTPSRMNDFDFFGEVSRKQPRNIIESKRGIGASTLLHHPLV